MKPIKHYLEKGVTMTALYEAPHVLRMAEEDVYKKGCDPATSCTDIIRISATGKTVSELQEKLCDALNIKYVPNNIVLDACDEPGRIDIAVMENEKINSMFTQEGR